MDSLRASRAKSAGIMLQLLTLAGGCGTSLLETKLPFSAARLAGFSQAGASLGCHERRAQLFPLFFFCPDPKHALGLAQAEGKLLISCPNLGRRACKKLFARLQAAVPPAGQLEATDLPER